VAALSTPAQALSQTEPAAASAAADKPAVKGILLAVPTPKAGQLLSTQAVDVTPLGVVAGTVGAINTNPDGSVSGTSAPQRWLPVGEGRWARQALPLPAGATRGDVVGLTDLGEVAANVTASGGQRPVRWSVTGRSYTYLGAAGAGVDALGPNGPWGVATSDGISGSGELVARDGAITPLTLPDALSGRNSGATSIGGPRTVLVGVISGVGQATEGSAALWINGAALGLPAHTFFGFQACYSRVQRDGSVAYSGIDPSGPGLVIGLHRGGIPGTDIKLQLDGGNSAALGCEGPAPSPGDFLSSDGTVAGSISQEDSSRSQATTWRAGVPTRIPLRIGEVASEAVAVATGGRAVVITSLQDSSQLAYLWHGGFRTPLAIPSGWTLHNIVELTDSGLVLGNLQNAAGTVQPVIWQTGAPS
jgi:hypothetical protein